MREFLKRFLSPDKMKKELDKIEEIKSFEKAGLLTVEKLAQDLLAKKDQIDSIKNLVLYLYEQLRLSKKTNINALQQEDIDSLLKYPNPAELLKTLEKIRNNGVRLTIKNVKNVMAADLDILNEILAIFEEYKFSQPDDVEAILEHDNPTELLEVLNALANSLCLTAENFRAVMFIPNLEVFKATLSLFEEYDCLGLKHVNEALIHDDPAGLLKLLKRLKSNGYLDKKNVKKVILNTNISIFNSTPNLLSECKSNNFSNENIDALNEILGLLKKYNCLASEDLKNVLIHDNLNKNKLLETLDLLENHDVLNEENVKVALNVNPSTLNSTHNVLDLLAKNKCDCSSETALKILKHPCPFELFIIIKSLQDHNFLNKETLLAAVAIHIANNQKNHILFATLDTILTKISKYDCFSEDVTAILKCDELNNLSYMLSTLEKCGYLSTENVRHVVAHKSLSAASQTLDLLWSYTRLGQEEITAVLRHDNPTRFLELLRELKNKSFLNKENAGYVVIHIELLQLLDEYGFLTTAYEYQHGFVHIANERAFLQVKNVLLKPHDDPAGRLKLLRTLKECNFLNEKNVWKVLAHAKPAIVESTLELLNQGRASLESQIENVVIKHADRPAELLMGLQALNTHGLLNTVNIARIMDATQPLVVTLLLTVIKQNKRDDVEAALKEPDIQRLEELLSKLYAKNLLTLETWAVAYPHFIESFNTKLDCPQFTRALQELKSAGLFTRTNILAAMAYTRTWKDKDDNSNLPPELKSDLPRAEKQECLNAYIYKMTKTNPSIWDNLDCLLVPIEIEIAERSASPDKLLVEFIELPFPINKEVFSVITTAFDKKISDMLVSMSQTPVNVTALLKALEQVLFAQALFFEGKVGAQTQKYLTNLNGKLEPILRAKLTRDKFDTTLLDEKRIIFCGEDDSTLSDETLAATLKYYKDEKEPLDEKIIEVVEEQLDSAITNIESLVALRAEDWLCKAAEKYIEAAKCMQGNGSTLTDFVKYALQHMRAVNPSDVPLQKLFQKTPFKEWAQYPSGFSDGETGRKSTKDETQDENSEPQKDNILSELQVFRKKMTSLEKENERLQKANASLQAGHESLEKKLAPPERERASLEEENARLQEVNTSLQAQLEEKPASSENEGASLEKDNASLSLPQAETEEFKKQVYKHNTDQAIQEFSNFFKSRNGRVEEYVKTIANNLETLRDKFSSENKYDTKSIANYINDIENAAFKSEEAKNLATHFGWQGLIVNVVIALTGVGLLFLAGKAIHSKVTQGCVSFFQTNNSLQHVAKVGEKFKREAEKFYPKKIL